MTARWVKPAERCYGPRQLVTVAVEGRPAGDGRTGRQAAVVFGTAAVCYSTYRDGKWRPAGRYVPASGSELIDFVHGLGAARKGTYIVCPSAQYAMTLCGVWQRWMSDGARWNRRRAVAAEAATSPPPDPSLASPELNSRGKPPVPSDSATDEYSVSACATAGKTDLIRYTLHGKQYTWASGHNWFPSTEESLAQTLKFEWSNPRAPWRGAHPPKRTPADRSMLWLVAMQRLADWWRQIDGGPWASTIGGLSMSYFRHRLAPKTVLAHQHDEARELEERSIFGGRAQTYCVAPIGPAKGKDDAGRAAPPPGEYPRLAGPLEHWDVASMYPTILATKPFPVRIQRPYRNQDLGRLKSDVKYYAVIADVLIDTDSPDYPFRDDGRVTWPTGQFRTVLAGPELVRALDAGHVSHTFKHVTYLSGYPFQPAAASLIKLRQDAKIVGNEAWEMMVKALSNAFGGKLAQKRFEWSAVPDRLPLWAWGEYDDLCRTTRKRTRFRAAGPLVWQRQTAKHHGRPLASCFTYLTSYGRELMHQLIRRVPAGHLVSCDTDGLWVRRPPAGLFGELRDFAAGEGFTLRRTEGATAGQWFDPRHYWTSRGWILSGYHEPRRLTHSLTFRDQQSYIPPARLEDGAPAHVVVTTRTTRLTTLPVDGRIGADGWVSPRRVSVPPPEPLSPPPEPSLAPPPLP